MNNECKILAPVGSMKTLSAAVFSGADYVYLSGNKYGARYFADNFNYDELKEAINFCHEYNVKVFVTVNISICESEIVDVVDYVFYLYSHGVDAVIIQDIGLGCIINSLMPNLELHASTQMTIYDYSFVKWLCENGYSNVNLSREVPIDRIKNITTNIHRFNHDMNVEVFGHGALCYCYSGQCLMSSFLGGRSGNRGLCAQPCRMRYTLEDEYGSKFTSSTYLLSTKDLCTYNNIEEIVDAGVNSIKIEGRMKPVEYVSSSVYAYRCAIDGDINRDNYLLLNLAFNRGLTSGYIMNNESSNVVGRERSGSQGYPIGRVIKVDENSVTIKLGNKRFPTKIVNGDGLKFEYDGESCGMYVSRIFSQSKNKIKILLRKNIPVKEDSMVYITYSKYLNKTTKQIINQKNIHKTTLNLNVSINNEGKLVIKCMSDHYKKTLTFTSKDKFEKAINKPLTKDVINKQLAKTGNTNYKIGKINYENFQEDLFMPTSTLNNIRRQLIEYVDKTIMNSYIPTKNEIKEVKNNIEIFKNNHYKKHETKTSNTQWNIYISSIEQALIIKDYDFIEYVYYDANYNYETIDEYLENIYDDLVKLNKTLSNKKIVWILPQLLLDKDLPSVSEILLKLQLEDIDIIVQSDNIGVCDALDVDCYGSNLNIYNNYSIEKLAKTPGFKRLAISNELAFNDIKQLRNTSCQLEYMVFGYIQLMLSKDDFNTLICDDNISNFYLVDKRNNRFKLKLDCYKQSHIFDYRILDLSRQINKIKNNTQIDFLSIDSRLFNLDDTKTILHHFNNINNNKSSTLTLNVNNNFYEANFEKGVYKK